MTIKHTPIDKHQNKLTYLLTIASIVIAAVAVGWTLFFIIIQDWLSVLVESTFVMLGYYGYTHTKHNNTKMIAHVYFPLLFVVMCFVCLFFDIPNAEIPRSNHHYFLPMALYAYVLYQDEHPYLKVAAPILICLAFMIFASTTIGFNLSGMTDAQRLIGVWVTNTVAIFMLFLVAFIMQSDFKMRHALELDLSKALLKNELELYYQPQVDTQGKTHGAEALSRWHHPSLGIIEPAIFIPLAKKTDLILHVGKHILNTACYQLANWSQHVATAHLTHSVNISVKQFQDAEFLHHMMMLIESTRIDAHKLQLEITESIFAHDLETMIEKMMRLKALGIKLSLDDFGTGYSSLAYVKKPPLDELKIDKSFIKEVLTNARDSTITKMIISLAHELHITIIAEGVETIEQRQFLMDNGCHRFQGYLYSSPLPIAAFNTFVLASNQNT